jgi:hypothetical protein
MIFAHPLTLSGHARLLRAQNFWRGVALLSLSPSREREGERVGGVRCAEVAKDAASKACPDRVRGRGCEHC